MSDREETIKLLKALETARLALEHHLNDWAQNEDDEILGQAADIVESEIEEKITEVADLLNIPAEELI